MSESKPTSFRVNDDDIAKFKEFVEKGGFNNQADAFKSLMQTMEMSNAKNMNKDRAKEIETFQNTINNLMGYFLNSLSVNQNSEERIREELSLELRAKDNSIISLYDQLKEVKENNESLAENEKLKNSCIQQANEEIKRLQKEIEDKTKNTDKLNKNNDLLQEQLQEYKQYREHYKTLESELVQLKSETEKFEINKTLLENTIAKLQDKISNDSEMIEFYKTNNIELKESIKSLEHEHKLQIQKSKDENIASLDEQVQKVTEQMKSKYSVELAQKELEIEKLKLDIKQLKTKTNKTTIKAK